MNLGIIGSRDFTNYKHAEICLDALRTEKGWTIDNIVSGAAKGADTIGRIWGESRNINVIEHKPDWSLGKGAGMARNTTIIECSDVVVAFWNFLSKGTKDSINKAKAAGKEVIIIDVSDIIIQDNIKKNKAREKVESLIKLSKK